MRTVGPDQTGTQVTIRVGDLLTVSPAVRSQGWQVRDYPKLILRMQSDAGSAASHSFVATAVGQGQLTLTAVGSSGDGEADTFTVQIRVLRNVTKDQQP